MVRRKHTRPSRRSAQVPQNPGPAQNSPEPSADAAPDASETASSPLSTTTMVSTPGDTAETTVSSTEPVAEQTQTRFEHENQEEHEQEEAEAELEAAVASAEVEVEHVNEEDIEDISNAAQGKANRITETNADANANADTDSEPLYATPCTSFDIGAQGTNVEQQPASLDDSIIVSCSKSPETAPSLISSMANAEPEPVLELPPTPDASSDAASCSESAKPALEALPTSSLAVSFFRLKSNYADLNAGDIVALQSDSAPFPTSQASEAGAEADASLPERQAAELASVHVVYASETATAEADASACDAGTLSSTRVKVPLNVLELIHVLGEVSNKRDASFCLTSDTEIVAKLPSGWRFERHASSGPCISSDSSAGSDVEAESGSKENVRLGPTVSPGEPYFVSQSGECIPAMEPTAWRVCTFLTAQELLEGSSSVASELPKLIPASVAQIPIRQQSCPTTPSHLQRDRLGMKKRNSLVSLTISENECFDEVQSQSSVATVNSFAPQQELSVCHELTCSCNPPCEDPAKCGLFFPLDKESFAQCAAEFGDLSTIEDVYRKVSDLSHGYEKQLAAWNILINRTYAAIYNLTVPKERAAKQLVAENTIRDLASYIREFLLAVGVKSITSPIIAESQEHMNALFTLLASLTRVTLTYRLSRSFWPPPNNEEDLAARISELCEAVYDFAVCMRRANAVVSYDLIFSQQERLRNMYLLSREFNSFSSLERQRSSDARDSNDSDSVVTYISQNPIQSLDNLYAAARESALNLFNAVPQATEANTEQNAFLNADEITRSVVETVGALIHFLDDTINEDSFQYPPDLLQCRSAVHNAVGDLNTTALAALGPLPPDGALASLRNCAERLEKQLSQLHEQAAATIRRLRTVSVMSSSGESLDPPSTPDSVSMPTASRRRSFYGIQLSSMSMSPSSPPSSNLNVSGGSRRKSAIFSGHADSYSVSPTASSSSGTQTTPTAGGMTTQMRQPTSSSGQHHTTPTSQTPIVPSKLRKMFGDDHGAKTELAAAKARRDREGPAFLRRDTAPIELIMAPDGSVKSASFRALIEHLTSHLADVDAGFAANFMMTYRSFTTSPELCTALCARFCLPEPTGLSSSDLELWRSRKFKIIQLRTINALRNWVENYCLPCIEDDATALNYVKEFTQKTIVPAMANAAAPLVRSIERRIASKTPNYPLRGAALAAAAAAAAAKENRKSKFVLQSPVSPSNASIASSSDTLNSEISVGTGKSLNTDSTLVNRSASISSASPDGKQSSKQPLLSRKGSVSSRNSQAQSKGWRSSTLHTLIRTGFSFGFNGGNSQIPEQSVESSVPPSVAEESAQMPSTPVEIEAEVPVDNNVELTFCNTSPLLIAQQLTLIEFSQFCTIVYVEFLNKAWSTSGRSADAVAEAYKRAPNLRETIETTNKISRWLVSTVLQPGYDVAQRAEAMQRVIKLAKHAFEMKNYNMLFAVLASLASSPLRRLHKTWAALPQTAHDTYRELCEFTSSDRNFKTYRSALTSQVPPCLPFVGRCLSDLTFIEDGNPSTAKPPASLSRGRANIPQLINFTKRIRIANVIREVQQFQACPFQVEPNERITQFILKSLEECLKDDELYEVSLKLEPRAK